MKNEIQNSEPINFLIEQPVGQIGDRKFYKCNFKKEAIKKISSLKYADLFYITKDHTEINNGAYFLMVFDEAREVLLFFEYLRKPSEDIESIEYSILEFLKRMNYNISDFVKSEDGYKYFNKAD